MSEFKVYGFHAIVEAISLYGLNARDTLYIARKLDGRLKPILEKAKKQGCRLKQVRYSELTQLCQSKNHQGILLIRQEVPEIPRLAKEEFTKQREFSVYLALDRVQDPQNLGSAIRTALGLGARGLILTQKNTCPYTSAVLKSSQGAMLKLPVMRVSSLAKFIQFVKEENLNFIVVGGSTEGDLINPDFFKKIYHEKKSILLVLGGEQGLSFLVKKSCDFLFRLPMQNSLESYNLSVAASLFLYEIMRSAFYEK